MFRNLVRPLESKRKSRIRTSGRSKYSGRVEELEPRYPLTINMSLDLAITQLVPNFYPDDFGNKGDYYFKITSARNGVLLDTSQNPLTLESGGFSFAPQNTPWRFQTNYQLDEDSFYDNLPPEQHRDLIIISLYDYDTIGDDDLIDTNPTVLETASSWVLDLNLQTGTFVGRYGDYFFNSGEFYKLDNGYWNDTAAGLERKLAVLSQAIGYDFGPVNRAPGVRMYMQGKTVFSSDLPNDPRIHDSDGDGLLNVQEIPAYSSYIPGTSYTKPDIFVTVDAMAGLAPSPLPPITGATNASPIVITSSGHGLTTGARVKIEGITGNTAANGEFYVERLSRDQFALIDSQGNGFYGSGGKWSIPSLGADATNTSLDLVMDAFDRAPHSTVGLPGVKLHITKGNWQLPRTSWTAVSAPTDLGGLSYYAALRNSQLVDPLYYNRYAVFADRMSVPRVVYGDTTSSDTIDDTVGNSYGNAGFAITLGAFPNATDNLHAADSNYVKQGGGQVDEQAATFMHFLGQSLGLLNGGSDTLDFKPNYVSVMNPLWMLPSNRWQGGDNWSLSYSSGRSPDIDESHLNEQAGLPIGPIPNFSEHALTSAVGPYRTNYVQRVQARTPVDLNDNGIISSTGIARDINQFRSWQPASFDVLFDHDDWGNLNIDGRNIGRQFNAERPLLFVNRELSYSELLITEQADRSLVSINDVTTTETDANRNALFTVSLDRPLRTLASVQWTVQFGGAADASDVVANQGTVLFLPGETSKLISVTVRGDLGVEPTETYMVILSNTAGDVRLQDAVGLGTIIDNDLTAIPLPVRTPFDNTWDSDGKLLDDVPSFTTDQLGTFASDSAIDSQGRLLLLGTRASSSQFSAIPRLIRYLPSGLRDTSFGVQGVLDLAELAAAGLSVTALTVVTTGPNADSILIAGQGSSPRKSFVARLRQDGSYDSTFGMNTTSVLFPGVVLVDFQNPFQVITDVTAVERGPQSGTILISGQTDQGSASSTLMARFTQFGSLDQSFGVNGRIDFKYTYSDDQGGVDLTALTHAKIDSQGRIIAAGQGGKPGTYNGGYAARVGVGAVMRFLPNGSLDTSFADSGAYFAPIDPGNSLRVTDVDVLSDDSIAAVVAGDGYYFGGRLIYISADGKSSQPLPPITPTGYDSRTLLFSVKATSTGLIYVGGYASPVGLTGSGDFMVARYRIQNNQVQFDTSFNPDQANGAITIPMRGSVTTLALDPTNNVYAIGYTTSTDAGIGGNARNIVAIQKYSAARSNFGLQVTSSLLQSLQGSVSYNLAITGSGNTAELVTVQCDLPPQATLQSISVPSGWVASPPGTQGTIYFTARNIQPGLGAINLQFTVTLSSAVAMNPTISTRAEVRSTNVESDATDNVRVKGDTVNSDLAIDVGSSHIAPVSAGTLVTFVLDVDNRSSTSATYAVTTTLPSNLTLVSATGNAQRTGDTLTWLGTNLTPLQHRSNQIVARATTSGYVQLTAQVQGIFVDAQPQDNQSTSKLDYNVPFDILPGIVSYYRADGNLNDTMGVHNALPTSIIQYGEGRNGQGFLFNGVNTSVDLGTWFNGNFQSYTINLWVKPAATQTVYADILDNNHPSNFVFQQNETQTNVYAWGVYDGNPGLPLFTLTANQWQLLTLSRDSATRLNQVYVNGVLKGQATGSGDLNYSNPFLRLGRWGGGGRNWSGTMDDVSIFSRALTSAEVLKIATGDMGQGNIPPLIISDQTSINVTPGSAAAMTGSFTDQDGFPTRTMLFASIGTIVPDSTSDRWNWSLPSTQSLAANTVVTVTANDGRGGIASTQFVINFKPSVRGAYLFYNRSAFDGNNAALNPQDDAAIATNKTPLFPGTTANFSNYSSYTRGINGLMIDLEGADILTLSASDFSFRVGNNATLSSWSSAAAPSQFSIRAGQGSFASTRVSFAWPDNAISNTWLQIIVRATPATKLTSPTTFYFGNAIGETNTLNATQSVAVVDIADIKLVQKNPTSLLQPATILNDYDFNRDRVVDILDIQAVQGNPTSSLTGLKLLSFAAQTIAPPTPGLPSLSAGSVDAYMAVFESTIESPAQTKARQTILAPTRIQLV